MKKLRAFGMLCVLVMVTACGRGKTEPEASESSAAGDPPASTISFVTSKDQPTIKVANWEETQQLVAQNPGKVVILDLWATW
jgi:ABC-type enterochelin transport system substrate-binding protein